MVSDRRFGLEIECGIDGDEHEVIARLNREIPAHYGWELDYDGTEYEIRTPPFQGEEGFAQLERAYRIIREGGGYVTSEDGGHVHLEAKDFVGDAAKVATLVRSWVNLEPAIERIVSPYRRGNYGSCPKVWNKSRATARYLRSREGYVGRGNLNINNISHTLKNTTKSRGIDPDGYCYGCEEPEDWCCCGEEPMTIELRLHEGTLNYEHMRAWIQMGQALLDKVSTTGLTIRSCARPDALVRRLDLDTEVGTVLVEKARTVKNPDDYYEYRYDY